MNLQRRRRKTRGSIMLLAIFFLILLYLMVLAFMRLLPVDLNAATAQKIQVQGAYTTDAAVMSFSQQLYAGTAVSDIPLTGDMGNGWTWTITNVETINGSSPTVRYYRLTCEGAYNNVVRRRCIATVQATLPGTNPLTRFAFFFNGDIGSGNKFAAFPYGVTVNGDVYVNDVWGMREFDKSGINLNNDSPPAAMINGVVYATKADTGAAPDKSKYVDGDLPYSGNPGSPITGPKGWGYYNAIYRDGVNGVKANSQVIPLDAPTIDADFLNGAWGIDNGVNKGDLTLPTSGANGLYINQKSDGVGNPDMAGGLYIKGSVSNIILGVDGLPDAAGSRPGHAYTTFQFGSAVKGPDVGTTPSTVTSSVWTVQELGDGSTPVVIPAGRKVNGVTLTTAMTINPGTEVTLVKNSAQPATVNNNLAPVETATEFFLYDKKSNGAYYVDGDISGLSGTIKGQRSIVAGGSLVISGELLKNDTRRGDVPTDDPNVAPDVLGLGTMNPTQSPNASVRTDIKISTATPDNKYYMYASLLGLRKADLENINGNVGSYLPSGAKLYFKGSVIQDGTVQGHSKKLFDFFSTYKADLSLDTAAVRFPPPFWPGTTGSGGAPPILKSYVDLTP